MGCDDSSGTIAGFSSLFKDPELMFEYKLTRTPPSEVRRYREILDKLDLDEIANHSLYVDGVPLDRQREIVGNYLVANNL